MDKYLLDLGFKPHYSGFYYTTWILENYRFKEIGNLGKLYEEVANVFGTTPGAVERAIRHFRIKNNYNKAPNKEFLNILKINSKYTKIVEKKLLL